MDHANTPDADGPDEIYIDVVGPIPVIEDDDPRFVAERQHQRRAAEVVDSLLTPAELQGGLAHDDEEVRWRTVSRLLARASDDPATLPLMLKTVRTDPSWKVRSALADGLSAFGGPEVERALFEVARTDNCAEVRDSAETSLHYVNGIEPS